MSHRWTETKCCCSLAPAQIDRGVDARSVDPISLPKQTSDRTNAFPLSLDGSGSINVEEFKTFWKFLKGLNPTEEEILIREAFNEVDLDKNGYIR